MSKIFRLIWNTVCCNFCELSICVCLTLFGAVSLASAETCSAVADGQAECTTKSGAQYVGKLKNGKPHGKGVLTMNNGNRYEGEFEDGYMEGDGKYFFKNGGYYEGEFKKNKFSGSGVQVSASGIRYKGEFKNDKFNGSGKLTYKDGGYREGTFVESKLQGEGVMVFKSGRYEGGFKNGEPHGKGVFTWDSGGRYEGDVIEGKRTGKGVYKFPDGGRYEGDYVDGKFSGKGVLDMKNGDRYAGEFKDGKFNGTGKLTFKKGGYVEGTFVDGKLHGKGVQVSSDGNRYEGNFIVGKRTDDTSKQSVVASSTVPSRPMAAATFAYAGEGIFEGTSTNDWCTVTRLGLWKYFKEGPEPQSLGAGARGLAAYFVEGKTFTDEFEKDSWKEKTEEKLLQKLKACDKFSDEITLEVQYTYRQNDYDFQAGELRLQISKDLAKYPFYASRIQDPNYVGRVTREGTVDEPSIGSGIMAKRSENGVHPSVGNIFKFGPSLRRLYSELGVQQNSASTALFRNNFRLEGYDDLKVPMKTTDAKKLRAAASGVVTKIKFYISGIEDGHFAYIVRIRPKTITFVERSSGKTLFFANMK